MLDKLIFLVALAGTAVVYADVLVRDGMLLQPVQRWLREWHRKPYQPLVYVGNPLFLGVKERGPETSKELDEQWWWPPLWGCYKCVAGQWGFWGYLIRYHHGYTWRTVPEHLAFTAFTILAAILIQKWIRE